MALHYLDRLDPVLAASHRECVALSHPRELSGLLVSYLS
jgi:hypothetical protein